MSHFPVKKQKEYRFSLVTILLTILLIHVWFTGGHINPAVTLAMVVTGRLSVKKLPIYWLAQSVGAFIASAVVYGVYKGNKILFKNFFAPPLPYYLVTSEFLNMHAMLDASYICLGGISLI